MTLKIKIPPTRQAQPPPPSLQPQSSIPGPMEDETINKPQRIRKKPKRFLNQDDEEYEAIEHKQKKPARNTTAKRDRRPSVTEPHSDAEMAPAHDEIDSLDATMDEPDVESEDASPPPPKSASSVKSQPKLAKGKGKAAAASKKKKRNVLMSDSEDEDDNYMDTTLDVEAGNDDDDDDEPYSPEEKPMKLAKRASSKGTSGSQGTKRKAKAEAVELVHAEKKAGSSVAASRKKPKLPLKNEEMIDVVGDSGHEGVTKADRSSPVPILQDSPVVAPKKPKLPTIKKNKLATSSGVSTPQSTNPSIAKPTIELGLNKHTNHGEIRQTMINQTDIDLSNKSIYQEIFLKMTGDTGTPRRTKEEERRKELNRLRDEARAKRLEEARHSFDLQAQYDKISRFEDKLRSERSSALWPNFLGAKWRENYEKEKRRQKEQQQWQGASYEGKEEGEVS